MKRRRGNVAPRFAYQGLIHHLRKEHLDWTMAQVAATWPAYFAMLRAACPASRNAHFAMEGRRRAAATRREEKSNTGGLKIAATPYHFAQAGAP